MALWNLRRILPRQRGERWLILGVSVLLAASMLFSVVLVGLRVRAKPLAIPVFRSMAESRVQELVRKTAEELLLKAEYGSICTLAYQGDGQIAGVSVDTHSANRLTAELTAALRERLSHLSLSCKVKSGDVLFARFFSGGGIAFSVRGSLYGGASAKLVSSLQEGGLNQTLHRLEVEVSVPVTMTVLGEREEFSVTSRILLCESVIVGAMPGGVVVG